MLKAPLIFVGIDVSKAQLDIAIRPTAQIVSVPNDKAGIKTLVKHLEKLRPTLVVLESTGGLERQVMHGLVGAEISVVMANPRQVRDFARSTGQLAKTDRIDAAGFGRYAETTHPHPHPLAHELISETTAVIVARRPTI